MTNNGWIKLHRKVLNNPIYCNDPTAWRIFMHLLLLVDRKTGIYNCGRFQLARDLNLKPTTTYKALLRLRQGQMVHIKSNNKFSEIRIQNWEKYQLSNTSSNNKVTTKGQQSNTKQEVRIKNKEQESTPQSSLKEFLNLKHEDLKPLQEKFPEVDVVEEYAAACDWLRANGRRFKNYLAFLNNWLRKAKKGFSHKSNVPVEERTGIEIKLIDFLRSQTTFKNPEAFIDKIKRTYGEKYLPKLLNIEVDQWYKFLNFWTKSKV